MGSLRAYSLASILTVGLQGCALSFNNPSHLNALGVSAADLVLLLRMEEATWDGTPGEVLDWSGMLHHGTGQGTLTTTASGRYGRGGLFDASGCVVVPDAPTLRPTSALTYTAWVYPTALDGGITEPGIFAKRIAFGNQSAYTVFLDTADLLYVDIDTEDNRFASNTPLVNNQWQHVAVVYDGGLPSASRVSVYINGALDIVAPETSATIPPFTSNLNIGCLPGGGGALTGRLDQLAVWHRALGSSEIQALYQLTAPL